MQKQSVGRYRRILFVFQQNSAPARRAIKKPVTLLRQGTPDYILSSQCLPGIHDLNIFDYKIWDPILKTS